jgi:hypothetical protein
LYIPTRALSRADKEDNAVSAGTPFVGVTSIQSLLQDDTADSKATPQATLYILFNNFIIFDFSI